MIPNTASSPLTVSELTARIKQLLEGGFAQVVLIGEVSRLTRHSSGHTYFTIKDEHAAIAAVIWRSQLSRLQVIPEEGGQYIFRGHISVYEAQGKYQLVVQRVAAAGAGALAAEFERRKRLFAARGWFEPQRKRPIPELPQHVGIVTSPHAAAWRDVQKVLATRPAWLTLTLSPCLVQGAQAPASIAEAIRRLQRMPQPPDVILLVRGGGSQEDLWCFNDEVVVKAVVDCPIPIISGIGHEIDTTLADLAADVRAATPSNAAELCCPDRNTLRQRLPRLPLLAQLVGNVLARDRKAADHAYGKLCFLWQRQQDARLRHVDAFTSRLTAACRELLRHKRRQLLGIQQRLAACEPAARLRRRQRLLHQAESRLRECYLHILRRNRHLSEQYAQRIYALAPKTVAGHRMAWQEEARRLRYAAASQMQQRRHSLRLLAENLANLDYRRVLARGYTLAQDEKGQLLTSVDQLRIGGPLNVLFHDGTAATRVQSVEREGN